MTYRCLLPLIVLSIVGCSTVSEDTSSSRTSDVETFIVRATEDTVVLRRDVDGRALPFDALALKDKTIIVHPISGKVDGGVFARAQSIEETPDEVIVHIERLGLEDAINIFAGKDADEEVDNVVTLHRDPNLTTAASSRALPLQPRALPPLPRALPRAQPHALPFGLTFESDVRPTNLDGMLTGHWPPPITVWKAMGSHSAFGTVTPRGNVSFNPELLARWSEEPNASNAATACSSPPCAQPLVEAPPKKALEIGVRGELAVTVGAHIFSIAGDNKPVWQTQEIATHPVYLGVGPPGLLWGRLTAKARCSAVGGGLFEADFERTIRINASWSTRLSGERLLRGSDWIQPGPWPNEVNVSVDRESGTDKVSVKGSAGVLCQVPVVNFEVCVLKCLDRDADGKSLFTPLGAYMTLYPQLFLGVERGLQEAPRLVVSPSVILAAGYWSPKLLGYGGGSAEVTLARWRPDSLPTIQIPDGMWR